MNAVKSGPFVLPPLPDAENALAPAISAHTLQFHCGKHHWGYVDRLNELVVGSELAALSLEELVRRASAVPESSVFRSAAQAWNHEFYWRSLARSRWGAAAHGAN